jgi:hypothetical protein
VPYGATQRVVAQFPPQETRRRAQGMNELRELQGRQVCVALTDGSRIDDCSLVSVGQQRTDTLWVFSNGGDAFIPIVDVVAVWEA